MTKSRSDRDVMAYDVVIVGAGPAGLSTGLRLKQLAQEKGEDLSVCILEKGGALGAHILSGAILDPRSLTELIPDWRDRQAPLNTAASQDYFLYLTQKSALSLPTPPPMRNTGNYIISLGKLVQWLGKQAEEAGVEIYPGFAATEILFHEDGAVKGVATGDMGVTKQGTPGPNFAAGMELHARQTVFAEGCRGHLGQSLMAHFSLNKNVQPQTYAIGLKELWEIPPENALPGTVVHTVGWPLKSDTYGGSFLYHLENNQVSIGFVIGLDYSNPYLSPYDEFQRFKHHPAIQRHLNNGRRISYGARALNEGGFQSIPKLTFPGGILVGCEAGFMNVPKIKGTHTAIKSGIIAADTLYAGLTHGQNEREMTTYLDGLKQSWLWDELYKVRNIRPSFKWGLWGGLAYSAIETYLLRGKSPWTLRHHGPDHTCLKPAKNFRKISYPKADGRYSFDITTNLSFSGTNHEDDQPVHLNLKNSATPISLNLKTYDSPEQRYCPAGVYEIIEGDDTTPPTLQINAQNCLHCKTCDIKDPSQNIKWVAPQGGEGPNYSNM